MTRPSSLIARKRVLALMFVAGLVLRIILVFIAGNKLRAPWSGGSDSGAYELLSENLVNGKGLSYSGIPTAMRPPIYPLVLAAAHLLVPFGSLLFVRILQLGSFVVTAWLCMKVADRLWGPDAGYMAAACLALSPTLLFLNSEIMTESFATLLTAWFVYEVVNLSEDRSRRTFALGLVSGVSMLLRFNAAVLPVIAAWRLLQVFKGRRLFQQLAVFSLTVALCLAPWFVRNRAAFNGKIVYSTLSGWGLVLGVYSPQGRAESAEYIDIKNKLGWTQNDLETNDPSRHKFGPELELNRQAMRFGLQGWREKGLGIIPLFARKLSYFWLSLDQVLSIDQVPFKQRILRRLGVGGYWLLLLLAIVGFFRLKKLQPALATTFLLYAIVSTLIYLPFAMNTRLRVSGIEPLLCVLAGGLAVQPEKRRDPQEQRTFGDSILQRG